MSRRPYLTRRVARGLSSIANRVKPTDETEAFALLWVHRLAEWTTIEPLEPQDAANSVSPSAEPASSAGSAGDGEETT